ncbi:hypothetical protein Q5O02_04890 [Bacillus stercoris]|uniref:hypothetical protein n=1 Tax=Bacillus stercoris TaxID=2054641 RepID=UPI000D425244|nr:hypothetical protein [Bacillus stercoris]MDO7345478.1 hypothetical protein [Bacillus stercoris]PTU26555.1 hypothetical protein DA469_17520 [Bacillus subtilis]
MKIIQYFPNSRGTKFLKQFQKTLATKYCETYEVYDKSPELFNCLESRLHETDLILITAHGTADFIEGELERGEPIRITAEDFHRFRNSFVFAFSCSTADLGEKICTESNVLSYLGFNDIVNLQVKTSNGQFVTEISNILRRIYNDTLYESLVTFIQKNYNISELAQLISLNLKRYYARLLGMTSEDIIGKYAIPRRVASNREFIKCLHADLLTTIDAVRQRITVFGEKNFIPWLFITTEDTAILESLLGKVLDSEFSPKNIYYKNFLLGYLYKKLNIKDSSEHYLGEAKAAFPEYEPLVMAFFQENS